MTHQETIDKIHRLLEKIQAVSPTFSGMLHDNYTDIIAGKVNGYDTNGFMVMLENINMGLLGSLTEALGD